MNGTGPEAKRGECAPVASQLLIRAAQEMVALQGWTGASSRKIAERAQLNPALINYYFRSKDALLHAALLASATTIADQLSALPTLQDTGVTEWLCDSVRALQDPGVSTEMRVVIEATVHAPKEPKLLEFAQNQLQHFRSLLTALLREEVKRGRLQLDQEESEKEIYQLASALAGLADGLAIQLALDPTLEVEAILRTTVPRLLGRPGNAVNVK